jgi:phospho-N-acetylmuramoyl-pentapeptide-transferase
VKRGFIVISIIYSILLSLFIALLTGLLIIPLFKALKLGQYIRPEAPKSHSKKAGTPSFGGIIFIFSAMISMMFFNSKDSEEIYLVFFSLIAFGSVGFFDDLLKTVHKNNKGLSSLEKMLALLLVSSILSIYAFTNPNLGPSIIIPFTGKMFNLKTLYIPFMIFFYVSTTNAVNLTDGIDGLAATITLIVMVFFSLVSFGMGHNSLAVFCGCLSGSLLGFLRFNSYPAKIIMGDTGSLALGGAIAVIAMLLKDPLIVILVGGIYVIETLSVLLQIISYKLYKKRIFKMAPIHHSLELQGWHEAKIVTIFSIVATILCLIAFLSF